jgi:outer membrane autotransporter protein
MIGVSAVNPNAGLKTSATGILVRGGGFSGGITNGGMISAAATGEGGPSFSRGIFLEALGGEANNALSGVGSVFSGDVVTVTPYAALDYVNARIAGFSESGGFGALAVNSSDSNSFQTTLGVRLTSRIEIGSYGTLIPEVRLGWNHEFLDAAQTISASLVGVPGSTFSATGIAFGRDTALVGAGLSLELAPDAKVFVDYDGKLGSRLQEHSISGGLRVRF